MSIQHQAIDDPVEVITQFNSKSPDRLSPASRALGKYILFLDSDCVLPDQDYLSRAINLLDSHCDVQIIGGTYLDSGQSNYLDRAYHWLCTSWIKVSKVDAADTGEPWTCTNLLGGCLMTRRSALERINHKAIPVFWGGEDTLLLRLLADAGVPFHFTDKMNVKHFGKNTFSKWCSRAVRHGYYRGLFQLKTKNVNQVAFWSTIRLEFCPALFVHFVLMNLGALAARVTRMKLPFMMPTRPPTA